MTRPTSPTPVRKRGVIFSGAMVRALLAGRRDQTRRALKPQPFYDEQGLLWWHWSKHSGAACHDPVGAISQDWLKHLPYRVGDRLWVREAWTYINHQHEGSRGLEVCIGYDADGADLPNRPCLIVDTSWTDKIDRWPFLPRRRSPVHMPRWASRLTLTVTAVRVERLQDISEADARAEGCEAYAFPGPWWQGYLRDGDNLVHQQVVGENPPDWMIEPHRMGPTHHLDRSAVDAYRALWNSLHGPDAWSANPWVAALTFTTEHRNIDAEPTP